jgi:hypothetical protein
MKCWLYIVAFLVMIIPYYSLAGQKPPEFWTDKDVCPGEGCQYGYWKAIRKVDVFDSPGTASKKVGTLLPGTLVHAKTGEVHVTRGKFLVVKEHESYRPGQILSVYTHLGEGEFRVWCHDRMCDVELDTGFWNSPEGPKECSKDPRCWGFFDPQPDSTWWIKLVASDGSISWAYRHKEYLDFRWCHHDIYESEHAHRKMAELLIDLNQTRIRRFEKMLEIVQAAPKGCARPASKLDKQWKAYNQERRNLLNHLTKSRANLGPEAQETVERMVMDWMEPALNKTRQQAKASAPHFQEAKRRCPRNRDSFQNAYALGKMDFVVN